MDSRAREFPKTAHKSARRNDANNRCGTTLQISQHDRMSYQENKRTSERLRLVESPILRCYALLLLALTVSGCGRPLQTPEQIARQNTATALAEPHVPTAQVLRGVYSARETDPVATVSTAPTDSIEQPTAIPTEAVEKLEPQDGFLKMIAAIASKTEALGRDCVKWTRDVLTEAGVLDLPDRGFGFSNQVCGNALTDYSEQFIVLSGDLDNIVEGAVVVFKPGPPVDSVVGHTTIATRVVRNLDGSFQSFFDQQASSTYGHEVTFTNQSMAGRLDCVLIAKRSK